MDDAQPLETLYKFVGYDYATVISEQAARQVAFQ